jgi:hypothetical protein
MPLTFRNERNTIALLMNCQITAVTKHYGIGILTVSIIANSTFGVRFFCIMGRFTVNSCGTTRPRTVSLWRLRIRFGDA